jgi:hypothetical protein
VEKLNLITVHESGKNLPLQSLDVHDSGSASVRHRPKLWSFDSGSSDLNPISMNLVLGCRNSSKTPA